VSTTSQLTTFIDLVTDLQNRARKETGVTATENQAKRYINIALFDMHISFHEVFPWAERQDILITHPSYTTGTADVTIGSATITGNSTLWNTNNDHGQANMRAGGKIRLDGTSQIYKIASVASDTSATLTSNYVGSTDTAVSYTYYEDEYALASDFMRPVDQHQFGDDMAIGLIGRNEFRRRFKTAYSLGNPRMATMLDLPTSSTDATPARKIAFYPYPSAAIMIPYSYSTSNLAVSAAGAAQAQLSADTDVPIVPLRYRHLILLHALWHWYRDKEDDVRSAEAMAEYNTLLARVAGDTEIGQSRAKIAPRLRQYARRAKRPWSPAGGRFDLDNRFDYLDDL
jgi:hypothetical protein